MKPTTDLTTKRKTATRLFPFTEEEEVRIILAMQAASRFMHKYGKGRKPRLIMNRDSYL